MGIDNHQEVNMGRLVVESISLHDDSKHQLQRMPKDYKAEEKPGKCSSSYHQGSAAANEHQYSCFFSLSLVSSPSLARIMTLWLHPAQITAYQN